MRTGRATNLRFGPALGGPQCQGLRRRLIALASGAAAAAVVADSLAGAACRRSSALPASQVSYLVIGYGQLIVYDRCRRHPTPSVASVARHVLDTYRCASLQAMAAHEAAHGVWFPFPLDALEILSLVWARFEPGLVRVIDLASGEIDATCAQTHPDAVGPVIAPLGSRRPPRMLPRPHHRLVGPSFRSTRRLGGLASLVSASAGVIRACRDPAVTALPAAVTRTITAAGEIPQACLGKSVLPSQAVYAALCEALERFQVGHVRPREPLAYGSYRELGTAAVRPKSICLGSCGDDARIYWTLAADPWTGCDRFVPAQDVWFDTQRLPGERRFIVGSTSACAVGRSADEAALFALLEAIERDAFLVMWYLRGRRGELDLSSLRDEGVQLLLLAWRRVWPGYQLRVFDLTVDTGVPAVAAFAFRRRGDGPACVTAAAARLFVSHAVRAVLADLLAMSPRLSAEGLARGRQLAGDLSLVRTPQDHFDLYAHDSGTQRLGFLDRAPAPQVTEADVDRRSIVRPQRRYDLRRTLDALVAHLRSIGIPVLLKDVTHSSIARRGLRCMRVIAPGLYPMWFGRQVRFQPTARLQRLARECRSNVGDAWNLDLHPFA